MAVEQILCDCRQRDEQTNKKPSWIHCLRCPVPTAAARHATCDSRHPGRTCGPHGVRIREVPALPAVPALRCHIAPKKSALKCFKQIRNLGLKVHHHSHFPPTESLGWGCDSFQASNIQRVVLQAHNNDNKEDRELILLCLVHVVYIPLGSIVTNMSFFSASSSRRPRAASLAYSPNWCPDITLIHGARDGNHVLADAWVEKPAWKRREYVSFFLAKPY